MASCRWEDGSQALLLSQRCRREDLVADARDGLWCVALAGHEASGGCSRNGFFRGILG